jgi:phosphatidylglycerol:prolipoprotein diacylglycerol transferase
MAVIRGKKLGFTFDQIYNVALVVIISSLVGSRIAYVFLHLDEFRGHWWDTISPIQSSGQIGIAGLVILGGVVLAGISTWLYLIWKKIPVGKMADLIAPSLSLGITIGRIGCFFNGCCFGRECHLPWAVTFPPGSMAYYFVDSASVHPTQLYEVIYCLIIFLILLWIDKIKKFNGFSFAWFLILYGLFRILNESLRYYQGSEAGMNLFHIARQNITFSQLVSSTMILIGILIILSGKRSSHSAKLS